MNNVVEYFRFAVTKAMYFDDVFQRLRLNLGLRLNHDYNGETLKKNIEAEYGFKIKLECLRNIVWKIEICFNKNLQPINCFNVSNNCIGGNIFLSEIYVYDN